MTVVVRVENVSKRYELGRTGTHTLKGDVQRWWAGLRGKEDPFAKVKEESNGRSGEFWALKDVSFDINQGDAIGIIGKNGAGKSTLLKILSRITLPTTGRIRVKGRIASLLEVGTGFNPDLSGRENIFLNGAILGMTKGEVRRKFDEIVNFSGVEKFIDTPVKRYSSGMYVRLAFAVAAHLDSEILILDEVLAVGDAEFQAKCLGKMDDVARKQGRTVIFVSHSMSSVNRLCSKAIFLEGGKITCNGKVDDVVNEYLKRNQERLNEIAPQRKGSGEVIFASYCLSGEDGIEKNDFFIGESVFLNIELNFKFSVNISIIGINITNSYDELLAHLTNYDDELTILQNKEGDCINLNIKLHNIAFTPAPYYISLFISDAEFNMYDALEKCITFKMHQNSNYIKRFWEYPSHAKTVVRSSWDYSIKQSIDRS